MNAKELYVAYGLGKAAGPAANPQEYSDLLAALEKAMSPGNKAELCMLKANFAYVIADAAHPEKSCGSGAAYGSALEALEGTDSELAYVYVRKLGLSKVAAEQVLARVPNWPDNPGKKAPTTPAKKPDKTPAKPDPKPAVLPQLAVAAQTSAVNVKTALVIGGLLLAALGVGIVAVRAMRPA